MDKYSYTVTKTKYNKTTQKNKPKSPNKHNKEQPYNVADLLLLWKKDTQTNCTFFPLYNYFYGMGFEPCDPQMSKTKTVIKCLGGFLWEKKISYSSNTAISLYDICVL